MAELHKSKVMHYSVLSIPLALALLMGLLNGISYTYIPTSNVCMIASEPINVFATALNSLEIVLNGAAVLGTLLELVIPKEVITSASDISATMNKLSRRMIMYPIITVLCTLLASLINPNIPSISANDTITASTLLFMGNILKLSGGIWNFVAFFMLDLSCLHICEKIIQKIAQKRRRDRTLWTCFVFAVATVVASLHFGGRERRSPTPRGHIDMKDNISADIIVANGSSSRLIN
ncbi:hypothetical protein M427DRAFT_30792 [Gonapodya prolifera JEL478]|uniref:Uncharacterized protein n=1 Tax=Gonapodya prolifera (strain JEL478) TaxID=1344416 RepID=A0A139AJN7_GONPJ|nr:hypothetical protein M427DRAFT_30792 [Gonapodya prolifera JEL478]|eukprot:KXS16969.1 hypothetical protein M427DRAFT_30792 [Gonapodya prolifera JEL478]